MNDGYPPLDLPEPEKRDRRREKPRIVPLAPEILHRRSEIAHALDSQVQLLSTDLRALSDEQRKAVFYRLEHNIPISRNDLSGTGLKALGHPSPNVTLAAPVDSNLDRLASKIQHFGFGPIRNGVVKNQWISRLQLIERADPKDRLSQDLRENYEALCTEDSVIFEVEFLSLLLGAKKQRQEIETWMQLLRQTLGFGIHGTVFEHEYALPTCRAVIRCKGCMFRTITEAPEWISKIRWIESRPRFQTFHEIWENFRFDELSPIDSPESDAPIICIIDTGVSVGNPFLTPVTRDDLLKSYLTSARDNPYDEYGHGSAVASLAAYYALNLTPGSVNIPRVWIAGARILNAENELDDERLFSSLLEEVVNDFAQHGVRIFCLSVGDSRRLWNQTSRSTIPRKSWVARKIDQLSRDFDVLFVTCSGNLTIQDIQSFISEGESYPEYLSNLEAKILDPGQASLAITTGSIARGSLVVTSPASPIALDNQPSPFTRSGPGIRGEIKPELVEYGGNLAIDASTNRVVVNRGLQVVAASNKMTPAVCLQQGTSFAAPRVAYKAANILRDLLSLGITEPSACLLRALLVNSASRIDPSNRLEEIEASLSNAPDALHSLIGYGMPDDIRATYCDDYSSVMFYDGLIDADSVLFFDIPIPVELTNSSQDKALFVTVAHAPEVQKWGLERYHGLDLKWRMFRGNVNRDDIVGAMSEEVLQSDEDFGDEENDSEVLRLPSELQFTLGIARRSRGTVQHDWHFWRRHRPEYSDGHYTLAIAGYKRWQRIVTPTRIAVVVRTEDRGQEVQLLYSIQQQALAALRAEIRS